MSKVSSVKKVRCKDCRRLFSSRKTLMEHLKKNRCPALRNRSIKNENFTSHKGSNKITHNIVAKDSLILIAKDNNNNNTDTTLNYNNEIIHNNQKMEMNSATLNSYTQVDFDMLTEKDLDAALSHKYGVIIGLLEVINFNDKYPENKNIYYTNVKDGFALVFTNKWESLPIMNVTHRIIYTKIDTLDNILNKYGGIISEETVSKTRDTMDDYRISKKIRDVDKALKNMNNFSSYIKTFLVDNHKKIMPIYEATKNYVKNEQPSKQNDQPIVMKMFGASAPIDKFEKIFKKNNKS